MSSGEIAMTCGMEGQQGIGIRTPAVDRDFFFSQASISVLKPTHCPVKWVSGAILPWVKRPGLKAKAPTNAKVKNTWSYTSTTPYFMVLWLIN
jgi:hypothetical protein